MTKGNIIKAEKRNLVNTVQQNSSYEFVKGVHRMEKPLPPGARVECRDSEWIVRNCSYDRKLKSYVVSVEGTSGFVEGLEATFLDAIDKIKVVNPLDIEFVLDASGEFARTKLLLDLWLRKAIPTTNKLAIGHKAAIKNEPFQHTPAYQALDEENHLRARILMADAVGLGKTIQVGILMSELIKRQRGKRILVVCLKSMALQFQKEIWSRFGIPLKMIDSQEVERIFKEIPGNMNPLSYFDKAIISMDTLKTNKMTTYLDKAHWDIVVIDECHNVARRGKGSGRSKLARRLSSVCDSLILTSATPHDGRKSSYGSLLELIDPTIVINPEDVTKSDLEKVAIRRFHKDVQTEQKIPDRIEHRKDVQLSEIEENILLQIKKTSFKSLSLSRQDYLFRTTLFKVLCSSPYAFLSVLENRLKKLKEKSEQDASSVEKLISMGKPFKIEDSPKYKELVKIIQNLQKKDRAVVFTENKATQQGLKDSLAKELSLRSHENDKEFDKRSEIIVIHAGLPEKTQQEIVESFASEKSQIKILLATDVASEGINLHYFCNHLIHYDLPWSLITIEQRNGRIDRYGQKKQPNIYYIVGKSRLEEISKFNEKWVVDKLLEKLTNVREQLGDVGLAMGLFDSEQEEKKVQERVEEEKDMDDLFSSEFEDKEIFGTVQDEKNKTAQYEEGDGHLFENSSFLKRALDQLSVRHISMEEGNISIPFKDNSPHQNFLRYSLKNLEKELEVKSDFDLVFSSDPSRIEKSIDESRKSTGKWPQLQYLWEINPVFQSLLKRVDGTFKNNEVLVANLSPETDINRQTSYFIVHGSITNKLGQVEVSEIKVAYLKNKSKEQREQIVFKDAMEALKVLGLIGKRIPNQSDKLNIKDLSKELENQIKKIIPQYKQSLYVLGTHISEDRTKKLEKYKDKITAWKKAKVDYLMERHKSHKRLRNEEITLVNQTSDRYLKYIEGKFQVQSKYPYVKPLAIIYSKEVLDD